MPKLSNSNNANSVRFMRFFLSTLTQCGLYPAPLLLCSLMHIVTLHHLTINFLGREIFRDLTWAIGDRVRVGLIGPNGAGKSSLLRAIAGELTPESGQVVRARGLRVGFLPQDIVLPPQQTVLEAASQPDAEIPALEAELARLDTQLGRTGDLWG